MHNLSHPTCFGMLCFCSFVFTMLLPNFDAFVVRLVERWRFRGCVKGSGGGGGGFEYVKARTAHQILIPKRFLFKKRFFLIFFCFNSPHTTAYCVGRWIERLCLCCQDHMMMMMPWHWYTFLTMYVHLRNMRNP